MITEKYNQRKSLSSFWPFGEGDGPKLIPKLIPNARKRHESFTEIVFKKLNTLFPIDVSDLQKYKIFHAYDLIKVLFKWSLMFYRIFTI